MVQARENSETMTARATASPGNDGGLSAPGASAKAAPCRAGALRARRADAWRLSPLPMGRWWPAVTRRPAPAPRVKQRLTGERHAVRVQQWTAIAGLQGSWAGT